MIHLNVYIYFTRYCTYPAESVQKETLPPTCKYIYTHINRDRTLWNAQFAWMELHENCLALRHVNSVTVFLDLTFKLTQEVHLSRRAPNDSPWVSWKYNYFPPHVPAGLKERATSKQRWLEYQWRMFPSVLASGTLAWTSFSLLRRFCSLPLPALRRSESFRWPEAWTARRIPPPGSKESQKSV